jgi:hypothetical protein
VSSPCEHDRGDVVEGVGGIVCRTEKLTELSGIDHIDEVLEFGKL